MHTVEPAIDPKNKISFLLDWEITLRCNLDCSYCGSMYHDNSTQHPPLSECLKTIDFMFEYVNIYMQNKPKWAKEVILNVYGGESIFHPDIITIYETIREKYKKFENDWTLTVQTTTNLVAGKSLINKLKDKIDYWTVSYHTEANQKQKTQFRNNILNLKAAGATVRVIVLMNPSHFDDAISMIEFCKENKVDYLPRQLDKRYSDDVLYSPEQVSWLNQLYNDKSYKTEEIKIDNDNDINMSKVGRACCGGRQVCTDGNFKQRNFFIKNNFEGWNCSVNWFFLYIRQISKEVFHNKDCRMKFDGTVGPIGNIDQADLMIDNLKNMMGKEMPVIKCAKKICLCGLCAPKADNLPDFNKLFQKYVSYQSNASSSIES
jgi:MoaA/NifB/PqqE/SkfB family radical SAM enzyme